MRRTLIVVILLILGFTLLQVVAEMPEFGNPNNPPHNRVAERYLMSGVEETGSVNIVTAIITDYRSYDTLGEVTVLFASIVAVLAVLGRLRLGVLCPEDKERGVDDATHADS